MRAAACAVLLAGAFAFGRVHGAAPVPASAPAAARDGVTVELRLVAPDALEVGYALPAACRELAFVKDGADGAAVRAGWQALDACGTAGADRLARGAADCPVLRFRVQAAIDKPGFPAAFPLGQGLYAHLSNYAVADSCGSPAYRLAAPWVAAGGQSYRDGAAAPGPDSAVMLLQVAPRPTAFGTPGYIDPRLPAATAERIALLANATVDTLRRALPYADFAAPMLAAGLVAAPGGPAIAGDASDVLRLSLYNWPRAPGPDEQAKLTRLVTHEFSHRFQLRDAVDVYPDARLIHEGGGEFLRWLVSVRRGWLTPAQAAADLDGALAKCMLYTGGRRWRALTPRQVGVDQLEYACGLPAYVYALAARQGKGTALARIDGFYREVKRGARPDFARTLDCGVAAAPCAPGWMGRLLDGEGPMEAQWDALFGQTGLAAPQAPSQAQRDAMVVRAVTGLMRDDCGGRLDSLEVPGGILLGGMKACKTFTRDAEVIAIEGLPFAGHPGTGAALAAACAARREVSFGLKDGATLAVPCVAPYPLRATFYHADIGRVLQALDGLR